ncbi:MAG: glycoside hydrolase family 9 protein [Bacteroidales bacterium]
MKRISTLFLLAICLSTLSAQNLSKYIVTDQFGYLPDYPKIAVIRDPQTGYDADESFTPGTVYALIDATTGDTVFSSGISVWKSGTTDASSGDKAWHFDFSSVTQSGRYYVLDLQKNVRSYEFLIGPKVYDEVLKQAVRMFFYQRAGCAKEAQFAGAGWADNASHIGPLQDKNCRLFSDKTNIANELDLSGGWYDAGDFNKYTSWTANYVTDMMKAYLGNPHAWADDYNIPESGNGTPDLLDEAKWGIDFLLRMQRPNGGVLCIVGLASASPPSSATGQSLYGPATTAASLNTSAAFAIASKVYRSIGMTDYADTLLARAVKAYDWAVANPAVTFVNNSSSNGSQGLGAGNQEEDDYGRMMDKLEAAAFLFEMTGNTSYKTYFESNYQKAHLYTYNKYAYPYEGVNQEILLYYATLPGITASVGNSIRSYYSYAMMNNSDNFPAWNTKKDPYLAHLGSYTWGSNAVKCLAGNMYTDLITYNVDSSLMVNAFSASLAYIHYIHGVNPLSFLYLSNMYPYGGDNGVNEFYHTWFTNGSSKWDRVGTSLYGPAPGFLTGGANPSYSWDNCCNTPDCGSSGNNALCTSEDISPPQGQPSQKSYKDFNTSWPLNSWSVTENSCGYQVSYLRLLSKFVDIRMDCNGDINGTARFDTCGTCTGGNTGLEPELDPCNCPSQKMITAIKALSCTDHYLSPSGKYDWTEPGTYLDTIASSLGCDSVLQIDLQFGQHSSLSYVAHGCDSYKSPSGKYTWINSGIYNDTIPNAAGCDSVLTINLEIGKSTRNTITTAACFLYESPTGKIWTKSGTYYDTLVNAQGCDSILTFKLTIRTVNTGVTVNGATLVSNAAGASYQWLDCGSGYLPLDGASGRSFTPDQSGDYAVAASLNGCTDTSACYTVIIEGVQISRANIGFDLHPNPAPGNFMIRFAAPVDKAEIELRNALGTVLKRETVQGAREKFITTSFEPGLYFVVVRQEGNPPVVKKFLIK